MGIMSFWEIIICIYSIFIIINYFIAAFNGAGKTRGASRGSGARHAPY